MHYDSINTDQLNLLRTSSNQKTLVRTDQCLDPDTSFLHCHCPMITHTSDSHQISSQKKTKSKLQISRKLPKFQILQETLHATHLMKLLNKVYKYEMDPTRTVDATERTCSGHRMQDGWTDGRSETNIPPTTSLWGGITSTKWMQTYCQVNGSMQNGCNSTVNTLDLHLFYMNSSALVRGSNSKSVIMNTGDVTISNVSWSYPYTLGTNFKSTSCEIGLRLMPKKTFDNKSTMPLPKTMLTHAYNATLRHKAIMS